jgi:hypothetical protein
MRLGYNGRLPPRLLDRPGRYQVTQAFLRSRSRLPNAAQRVGSTALPPSGLLKYINIAIALREIYLHRRTSSKLSVAQVEYLSGYLFKIC